MYKHERGKTLNLIILLSFVIDFFPMIIIGNSSEFVSDTQWMIASKNVYWIFYHITYFQLPVTWSKRIFSIREIHCFPSIKLLEENFSLLMIEPRKNLLPLHWTTSQVFGLCNVSCGVMQLLISGKKLVSFLSTWGYYS